MILNAFVKASLASLSLATLSQAIPTALEPRGIVDDTVCVFETVAVSTLTKVTETFSQKAFSSSGKQQPSFVGYLFIYFKDETEQVNAALSVGNNALNYAFYNAGEPILTSNVGSNHTRDPFLVTSPDRQKFWIIATDNSLKLPKVDATRSASRKITIYESEGATLTKWKPARLSPALAGATSGGVAAPEAYWIEEEQSYMVIFGSNKFEESDPNHTGTPSPSEIYYCYTKDFQTFTEAKLYYNIPDGGLSDMTIAPLEQANQYVRFFRDDTNGTLKVRGQYTNQGIFGEWQEIGNSTNYVSKNNDANGGPLIFKDNRDKQFWHVWIDYFTGGYKPYESNDIKNGVYTVSNKPSFPKDLKQGSVTPVTCKEYNELLGAF